MEPLMEVNQHLFDQMSSEIKLDIENDYENYEAEVGPLIGNDTLTVGVSGIYSTPDDFQQGMKSISDIASPRERRSTGDRLLRPNRTVPNSFSNHGSSRGRRKGAQNWKETFWSSCFRSCLLSFLV
ncbi:Minor tail protein Gp26 [Bienertia sinuspersici]